MSYLVGKPINITTPNLKKEIGTKVTYLLKSGIDKSGRGYFSPRAGTITQIHKKHVDFGNGELISFSSISELTEYTVPKTDIETELLAAIHFFEKKKDTLASKFLRVLHEAVKLDYTYSNKNLDAEISKVMLSTFNSGIHSLFTALYDPQTSVVRYIIDCGFVEEKEHAALIKKIVFG